MIGRPLVIDAAAKAKAEMIIHHAEAHPWDPTKPGPPPGDDPNFTTKLNDYRVVFSITDMHGVRFRQLSVSVPSQNLPHPIAVFMICELFGFKGWDIEKGARPAPDWIVQKNDRANCIVVAEPIGAAGKVN